MEEDALTLDKAIKICKAYERATQQVQQSSDIASRVETVNVTKPKEFSCKRCGGKHQIKQCPAYNKVCHKCKGKNHFARQCKSRSKKANEVDVDVAESEVLYVNAVDLGSEREQWTQTITFANGYQGIAKLDTGAECNVMSIKQAKMAKAALESSTTKRLITFNKSSMKVIGEARCRCTIAKLEAVVRFKVVAEDVSMLLGRNACLTQALLAFV